MILLSINVRGVGGIPKFSALKILVQLVSLDIIFLQETMVTGLKGRDFILCLFPTSVCCFIDFVELLGGLILAWNLAAFNFRL